MRQTKHTKKRPNDEPAAIKPRVKKVGISSCEPEVDSFTQSEIVTILVGGDRNEFFVHRMLLEKHSEYFAASLRKQWSESTERAIILPDDDPIGAQKFFQWVYTGKVTIDDFEHFTNMYVFADKTMAGVYTNQLMDVARSLCVERDHILEPHAVKKLYIIGRRGKPAAKFAVEDNVWNMMQKKEINDEDQSLIDEFSEIPELAKDVMMAMLSYEKKKWDCPAQRRGCCYHEHTDGGSCTTTADD